MTANNDQSPIEQTPPPDLIGVDDRPLTPLEWRIYLRSGIAPDDVAAWIAAGLRPYQSESYRAAGLDLPIASRLAASGVSGAQACTIRDVDELLRLADANDAERSRLAPWTELGLDRDEAETAAAAQVSPAEIARLLDAGYRSDEIGNIIRERIDLAQAVEWKRARVSITHLFTLHDLAISPATAAEWSRLVSDPRDARQFAESGFRPEEAAPWWLTGLLPEATRGTGATRVRTW